jgi:hypothetical protein
MLMNLHLRRTTMALERTLLPPIKAAQYLGIPIQYFRRAVRAGVLPDRVVLKVGRRKRLIDVTQRDAIVEALSRWNPEGYLDDDREARLKRIVEGGE